MQAPVKGKRDAANWKRYELGEASWPMTCIVTDMDGDGDMDIATTEENGGWGVIWFENSLND